MSTNRVRNLYIRSVCCALFVRYKLLHPDCAKLIGRNKQYHNIHQGKRCFILGNGPSLKREDLSLLRDEYVFTVNQATRLPQFHDLHPNYHFWADPVFFRIDENNPEDMELLQTMLSVAQDNPALECFFPVQQADFVRRFHLDEHLHINYYYTGYGIYEGFNGKIDYTKQVPGFGTVVHWCVTMAIYMGFREIYLLGCDNTGIITTVKSILHQNDDNDYAYAVSDNEKTRMEKMLAGSSLEAYLQSYCQTLTDYRLLYAYCRSRQIKLVNCSAETVVDSVPRDSLTRVLQQPTPKKL